MTARRLSSRAATHQSESRLEISARRILACAARVRKELGAGRSVEEYEAALDRSMRLDQLQFARQYPFGMDFLHPDETGFRADFVVDGWILLELTAQPALRPEDVERARQYLQVSGCKLCLLINFGRQPVESRRLDSGPETKP